ncbi:MAG: hypothetical protein ACI9FZ_001129 [Bacteroidia bacterium]|jgi:hypothetical protein
MEENGDTLRPHYPPQLTDVLDHTIPSYSHLEI